MTIWQQQRRRGARGARVAREGGRVRARRSRQLGSGALALALFVGGASISAPARAQATAQQKPAAEALFDEGRRLLEEGRFARSCRQLEQSQAIDPGVGPLLYLGKCYERTKRLASAWATFREASSAACAAGQSARSRTAASRAESLRDKLAYLTLQPPATRPVGMEVLLEGNLVSAALYGVPFPVDLGAHQLLVRAPGHVSHRAMPAGL